MPQTHDIDGLREHIAKVIWTTPICDPDGSMHSREWPPAYRSVRHELSRQATAVLEDLKPMIAERERLPVRAEDLRLVSNIKWLSDDKDNMEFVTRASTFQVEALRRIVAALTQSGEGL